MLRPSSSASVSYPFFVSSFHFTIRCLPGLAIGVGVTPELSSSITNLFPSMQLTVMSFCGNLVTISDDIALNSALSPCVWCTDSRSISFSSFWALDLTNIAFTRVNRAALRCKYWSLVIALSTDLEWFCSSLIISFVFRPSVTRWE